jgi:hypothetical protein
MSDIQTLRSYLVGLGFNVNTSQYNKFLDVLKHAGEAAEVRTVSIAASVVKWQAAIVGMFATVSGAIVTALDKVSMADQSYRLLGERMFMDTAHARALKVALDALGQPLEAIAFDPELHARFSQLQKDQKNLASGLGPDFEANMRGLRDIRFEFTRLQVELQYFLMGTANQIFKALGLGSGTLLEKMRSLNSYIQAHIPEWARLFATYIVPVLKDTWMILKDVFILFKDLGLFFTNFVAVLSGDSKLTDTTFKFEKFAFAVEKLAHWLAIVVDLLTKVEQIAVPALGVVPTIIAHIMHKSSKDDDGGQQQAPTDIADKARGLAAEVSQRIGVPADIIFAQWAHETGNFTNRGATQLNNLAGIRQGLEYRNFSSLDDFANYYSGLIQKRYPAAIGSQNTDQFAAALKAGGYYEDTYKNYSKGMRAAQPSYSGGSASSSVSIGSIYITQPNASAQEIANEVASKVSDQQGKQTQRLQAQLTPVFQ